MKHYQNKIQSLLLLSILAASVTMSVYSCKENDDKLPGGDVEDAEPFNEFEELAELAGDSVDGVKVSKECAVACYRIEQVSDQLDFVKSPDGLSRAKRDFQKNLADATADVNTLSGEEKAIAIKHEQELKAQYERMCREYEVPAIGVIANLTDLIQRIDKIHDRAEFDRFRDCRVGMLNNLDNIHLCVDHNSNRINEVKRLAQTLKSKYEAKKKELGIN